jgi:hypothetical protein
MGYLSGKPGFVGHLGSWIASSRRSRSRDELSICVFARAKEAGLQPAPQFGETLNCAFIHGEMLDSREGDRGGTDRKGRSMPATSSTNRIIASIFTFKPAIPRMDTISS